MVFFRNFEGIFETQKQSAVGNAEVRTSIKKHRMKSKSEFWPEIVSAHSADTKFAKNPESDFARYFPDEVRIYFEENPDFQP